jgi:queuine tRNA-ribosyltransferase
MKPKYFKTTKGRIKLPVFFPDATRAVVRTIDSTDIKSTKTPGVLVNTYHLYKDLGKQVLKKYGGIREFMSWDGGVISDSGGFQVMSLAKSGTNKGKITNEGVTFREGKKKILLTPEKSIQFQMLLNPHMVVVLDDFTHPKSDFDQAKETVDRTILWAERCKDEFEKICKKRKLTKNQRPYLLGVVQGGSYPELRVECATRLSKIGFDGFGYGGWPMTEEGKFDYASAKIIADNTPKDYLLYGLGVGKPDEIVALVDMGYTIFDCVLPTRDARHKRLYVYNAKSIEDIDVRKPKFYSYFVPTKEKYYRDSGPVSAACDCLLCTKYTRAYLAHLFRIKDVSSLRLSTIHNLRFYSLLMEKLQKQNVKITK